MASRFTQSPGAPSDAAAAGDDGRPGFGAYPAPLTSRMLLMVMPLIVTLLGAALVYAVAPRTYTGATSVLIDARTGPAAADRASVATGPVDPAIIEEQARRIASDSVLRRTVLAGDLAEDPEFAAKAPGIGRRLARLLGLDRKPASDRVAQATLALASRLAVRWSAGSPIVDVGVMSQDAAKAARLSDAVAAAYLADAEADRTTPVDRATGTRIDLAAMAAAVQDATRQLDKYRHDHGIAGVEGAPDDGQELLDSAARLSEAAARAADIKARLEDIRRAKSAGSALDVLPDSVTSPLLDKLRAQYADLGRQQATLRQTLGDRHPAMIQSEQQLRDVRRLIGGELSRIQAGSEAEYRTAQADVAALQARIKSIKSAASAPDPDRRRLADLQSEVEVRQAAYDRAVQDQEATADGMAGSAAGRIVAASAVPTTPSSPRMSVVLALALALGVLSGLILMAVAGTRGARRRTQADPEASSPRDLPADPALVADYPLVAPATPVLGIVPSPFGNPATLVARDGLYDRLRTSWPTSPDAEHVPSLPAFRAAIHALMLDDLVPAHADRAPRTVLVTSLDGADSRTAFVLGLAEAAAGQGRRAIVIDADEQGSILRELVSAASRPILIDLMGTSRICYRVTSPLRGSLSIVPIMPGEATIVRRLGAQGAAARIDGLAANFDLILFDGPRAGGSSRLDAMAATVDAVIVTLPKATSQAGVEAALASLDLPRDIPVSTVLLAGLAEGATASAAA